MASSPHNIVATDILFFHGGDERAFIEWIDRMSFVSDTRGIGREMFIYFSHFPTDDDLWEIIGFCRRYGVDMAQLAKFETNENTIWMRNPKMIWHADIFGDPRNGNAS